MQKQFHTHTKKKKKENDSSRKSCAYITNAINWKEQEKENRNIVSYHEVTL